MGADVAGSRDHPMVSRYDGAEILRYSQEAFTDYGLIVGPIKQRDGKAANPESVNTLEGKLTRILYRLPDGRSTLEVLRNYEAELKQAGFEVQYQCAGEAGCGGRYFAWTVVTTSPMVGVQQDQRYLAARLKRDTGDIHVSLYLNHNQSAGKAYAHAQLDVIEIAAMQTGMVSVDAEAMAKGLGAEGHIALYGIYFDTDKAEVKTESRPTLDEIAKLLKSQPNLKLLIVGHTDNQGALDYNLDLSRRRAAAVVKALTGQHGVAAARLQAHGVGYLAPVASNRDEAGRAKNRRVELVEQ
jgi:outer membrane protein OmpA-like peptidoglycan-associated protein